MAYAPIADRPTHYGNRSIAESYSSPSTHKLGCFQTTRPIRVYDIRYLRIILRRLLSFRKQPGNIEAMGHVAISHGICSFRDQIELLNIIIPASPGLQAMKDYYAMEIEGVPYERRPLRENPFSPEGIRVGETVNDALTLIFMKEVLQDHIDGYIAPRIRSVYHYNNENTISSELVIFNPLQCGIREIEVPDKGRYSDLTTTELLSNFTNYNIYRYRETNYTTNRTRGGSSSRKKYFVPDSSPFFYRLESRDKEAKKQAKKMITYAKSVKKQFNFYDPFLPRPSFPLSPWPGGDF